MKDGKYYVDEILESIRSNAEEKSIRKDGYFETTVYIRGEEFEQELEDLISQKNGKVKI